MKRTRGAVKTYVESSSSDEETPLVKKLSPESSNISKNQDAQSSNIKDDSKSKVTYDSSSSESDIENYLKHPDKLDLDSEFFNLNTKQNTEISKETVPDFNKIENEIFAGITRLSESDSNSDNDFQTKKKNPVKKNIQSHSKYFKKNTSKKIKQSKSKLNLSHGKLTELDSASNTVNEEKSQKKGKKTDVPVSTHSFKQLQEYTNKIEEAKRFVEIYKAKKQAEENKTDILGLLAAGEGLTTLEQKFDPADLHSSDFDSCDSEQEGWEEINQKEDQEEDKNDVPKKNVEITVSMPGTVKKKKGVDLLAAMKRRLNRIRKENQVLIHKVHLLCWIAHGKYLNTAINSTQTLGMALSLLPSEQCYPSERTDLSYLEQIVNWYKRTIKCIDKSVPNDVPLDELLQMQINKKEAYNRKMLVLIFIAILRSLGIQCRLVISLQPEPLRPPISELHSLSTRQDQLKAKHENPPKSEKTSIICELDTLTCKSQKPNLLKLQSKNPCGSKAKALTSKVKDETKTIYKKDTQQKAKDKNELKGKEPKEKKEDNKKIGTQKIIQDKPKNDKNQAQKPPRKLEVKKSNSRSKSAESKVLPKIKNKLDPSANVTRSKSSECIKSNTPNQSCKSKETKKSNNTKCELEVRITKMSKSFESVKSDTSKKVEKITKHKRCTKDELNAPSTVKRSKSTESVTSDATKPKSVTKNTKVTKETKNNCLEIEQGKKRSKSSENKIKSSKDEVETTNSRRKTRSIGTNENTKQSNKNKKSHLLEVPKSSGTRQRRSKSTDSKSDASDNVSSTRSTKSDKSTKSEKTKRVIKVKAPVRQKRVSQVDGLFYLSDPDEGIDKHNLNSLLKEDIDEKVSDFIFTEENAEQVLGLHEEANCLTRRLNCSCCQTDSDEGDSLDEGIDGLSIPQLDGPAVTVSKAKRKPDLSKLKDSPNSRIGVKRSNLRTSESLNVKFPKKQLDVRNDIMNLIKGRISEQKQVDKSRLVHKRKSEYVSDSDSDYAPEPVKKKHHDSEDEFIPKIKVKKRIPSKSAILAQENDEKKKKIGNDYWVEVFLESEEKWICADLVYGQVHCVKEVFKRATQPVSYVLAWNNDDSVKDVTQRYCVNFNTVTRKLRIDAKWWTESIKPYMGKQTPRDKEEDNDLARQQLDQPLPKSIAEYKNHPLYVLKRHLLKFEALYPPESPTLGFVRGEAVYPRGCVYTLHSRDIWLKQAKVVKLGEQPYKIVKARPKWDRLSNSLINDQMLEIFGPWQVEDYVPPNAENGKIPRNAFGNVDLFKPCMLPGGCVHLKLPGLNRIAKKLNIDCVAAIVGFDFHSGWSVPVYEGFVVCKEFEDTLIHAWDEEQLEIERKEQEKIEKRVYGNWKKLIKGLLIRERLKARYDFGEPSGSGASKDKKKKSKGATFCTKKRRVYQNSESDSN